MARWILCKPFVLTFSDTVSTGDKRVPSVTARSGSNVTVPIQPSHTGGGGGELIPARSLLILSWLRGIGVLCHCFSHGFCRHHRLGVTCYHSLGEGESPGPPLGLL